MALFACRMNRLNSRLAATSTICQYQTRLTVFFGSFGVFARSLTAALVLGAATTPLAAPGTTRSTYLTTSTVLLPLLKSRTYHGFSSVRGCELTGARRRTQEGRMAVPRNAESRRRTRRRTSTASRTVGDHRGRLARIVRSK